MSGNVKSQVSTCINTRESPIKQAWFGDYGKPSSNLSQTCLKLVSTFKNLSQTCLKRVSNLSQVSKTCLNFQNLSQTCVKLVSNLSQTCPRLASNLSQLPKLVSNLSQTCLKLVSNLSQTCLNKLVGRSWWASTIFRFLRFKVFSL